MKKLLFQLLEKWACKHEWSKFREVNVYDEFSGSLPINTKYMFVCRKCVKIKKVKL